MAENSVISNLLITESSKDKEKDIHFVVNDLQNRLERLELVVFAKSHGKTNKLFRIKELADNNEKVTISLIRAEFGVKSANYLRYMLQEAAKFYGLVYQKGSKGQESFVSKFKNTDKVQTAYFETYTFLLEQPIGATTTESAIARKYDLNAEQVQSVLSMLSRCRELSIIFPDCKKGLNTVGGRRVKHVQ